MTQEDKELLLKDLIARLPYGVKVLDDMGRTYELQIGNSYLIDLFYGNGDYVEVPIKPYLRSMDDMTKEEKREYDRIYYNIIENVGEEFNWSTVYNQIISEQIDWLNTHHFNYKLPEHLYIKVTKENNPYL